MHAKYVIIGYCQCMAQQKNMMRYAGFWYPRNLPVPRSSSTIKATILTTYQPIMIKYYNTGLTEDPMLLKGRATLNYCSGQSQ